MQLRVWLRMSLKTIMGMAWNALHVKLTTVDIWHKEVSEVKGRGILVYAPTCIPCVYHHYQSPAAWK
jgi:hypothetical protein